MKTTLLKGIGLLSMLLFAFNHTHAKTPKHRSKLLLPHLLHDSSAVAATANKNSNATDIQLQSSVQHFVDEYLDENGEMLEKIKQNNSARFKTIQTILLSKGIPAELMYLAVIESKLKNNASSGAGAAGIWQLMPVTARTLGLKVNGKTDERRYTHQSTVAAAKYLNQLYNQFDDWLLVVAAYNCGTGNVYKAIKKSGSHEFWKLQHYLPGETSTHVKRFIATHFYYEAKGSIVTLTKSERNKYLSTLNKIAEQEPANKQKEVPSPGNNRFNWVLILHEQDELVLVARR